MRHVRLGSETDILMRITDVRLPLKADIDRCRLQIRSVRRHCTALVDYLIGEMDLFSAIGRRSMAGKAQRKYEFKTRAAGVCL